MGKYTQEIRSTAPIIRDFLNYMLVVKGKSQLTVDEYYKDLRTFFRYIKIFAVSLQRENIIPWRETL